MAAGGAGGSRLSPLLNKITGEGTSGNWAAESGVRFWGGVGGPLALGSQGSRSVGSWVRYRLLTIHPHPGPVRVEGRVGRRERRRRRRNNFRRVRGERRGGVGGSGVGVTGGEVRKIVTWNVRRLTMREHNRDRLRRVVGEIVNRGWEIVLMTEVKADERGVVWLGEEEGRVAVIHSERAAIVLRERALEEWVGEGQRKWLEERVVSVVLGGMRLVSVYQPIWGSDEEGMERCRGEMEKQVEMGGKEKLIIGGDFNASVGRNQNRPGVCGRYGLGLSNEAGRDLVNWCGEVGLAYANSYVRHVRRGTWFHQARGRWYELDGFLVRSRDRGKIVRKMRTIEERVLSDHKPKTMEVMVRKRREWRAAGGGREQQAKWELLGRDEVREEYRRRVEEAIEEEEDDEEVGEWEKLGGCLKRVAREVCGVSRNKVANPWMIGREEEVGRLSEEIRIAVVERDGVVERGRARMRLRPRRGDNRVRDIEIEIGRAREKVKVARREHRNFLRRIEKEWWDIVIGECEEACQVGRLGDMYKALDRLAKREWKAPRSSTITVEQFRNHFEGITRDRYEELPGTIREAVCRARDLRDDAEARDVSEEMEEEPSEEEIRKAMREMKDSAPGEDGVRLDYIRKAGDRVIRWVVRLVQDMWRKPAEEWEESLKAGIMIPLHKKGDRGEVNNYRGVCLLAMGSRVLARIVARRSGVWAERVRLLDENQAGFRRGRSTADVVQIMVRLEEDVVDGRRRVIGGNGNLEEGEWPEARLLDLRKAYPRVNRPGLWMLLERYGLGGNMTRVVRGLHETTRYKVRGKEGTSGEWVPERGLREGCSTSPVLFNLYHQAVMRQAEEHRLEIGGDRVGVNFRWVPGGSFAGAKTWERGSSEAKVVKVSSALFADGTTFVGKKSEMEEGVRAAKEVMGRWEERNNEDKEERLEFGTEEGREIRVLGSWVGSQQDIRYRIRRAGGVWGKVKAGLKGSRLSKKWQARIVEATVVSSLLYDCQARVWWGGDIRKLQKWVDRCYRYIWGNRNREPLREMQNRHINMVDVRDRLGVRSIRSRIEKRVLERIGHVLRMGDDRITKAVVLGWWEKLEGWDKKKGKKRKTVLYWKRLLGEAGIDWTDIERLVGDRDGWKEIVGKRVKHIDKWDSQKGHEYRWEEGEDRIDRSVSRVVDLVCRYEGCGKVCLSKGGLTLHQKRMHRAAEDRVRFSCGMCGTGLETEGARANHEKTCGGGGGLVGGRRRCENCGSWGPAGNYARHVRNCVGGAEGGRGRGEPVRGVGARRECDVCGRLQSASNWARHRRTCQPWDPGGGPRP